MLKQRVGMLTRLRKDTHGFGVIEGIIILAVVLVLAVVGWFVLRHSSSTTTYKNAEYGLQFDYPKLWGNPTSSTTNGKTGKLYELRWSGTARAEFATKDYKPDNTGGVIHGQITLSCTNEDSQYVVWLYFDGPSCTSAAIFGLPNKTVKESVLVATKKLPASSKLGNIEFAFESKRSPQTITGKADLQKLYTDADRQAAIDLAKSIK
jgi:hypothetical protein